MSVQFNLTIQEIADIVQGKCQGDNKFIITGVNSIDFASSGELTFISDNKYFESLHNTKASCVIIPESMEPAQLPHTNFIVVNNPYTAFTSFLMFLADNFVKLEPLVHDSVIVGKTSTLGNNIRIGAGSIIGENCQIGDNTIIYPNVTIYDNVKIDTGAIIHSNVVICSDTVIGKNVLILPGAVIGSEGFGFINNNNASYKRIPQLGNVVIHDNVEIGANTTIDRAMVGSTIIDQGVKLDNLIQIAHNVRIGENTAIAAQTGVSGSTIIGKRAKIGGQVGITGHIELTDDIILLAQSGVTKSITEKGMYFGSPAKSRMTAFKIQAILNSLPELLKELNHLKKELEETIKKSAE